ncbi:MAG: hypothetical protein KY455_01160 [Euryarchaeota archaeon]|nr:hypothetical protein [Euryarchaeota archaeon]
MARLQPLFLIVLFVALLVPWSPAAGQTVVHDPERGEVLQSVMHKLLDTNRTVRADRVPLFEMWTATWCLPCAPADRAADRMLEVLDPAFLLGPNATGTHRLNESSSEKRENGVAFVAYHPLGVGRSFGNDPFGFPEGAARIREKYGDVWFPSVWVDGIFQETAENRANVAAEGLEDIHYETYRKIVSDAGKRESPLVLDVRTVVENETVRLEVRATARERIEGPLVLTGVLWEDGLRHAGENGIDIHRMTAKAMFPREAHRGGLATNEAIVAAWTTDIGLLKEPGRSGVTVFVEQDWRASTVDPLQGRIITFFIATGIVFLAFLVMARYERRRRVTKEEEAG